MPASLHLKLRTLPTPLLLLALGSISVLNWSLYHETCNVSSLKYDRNTAETILRCSMIQILVLSGKSILFIFRRSSKKGNEGVDLILIRACLTLIQAVGPASLSLTSLTITSGLAKTSSCCWGGRLHRPGRQASQQTFYCEIGHGGCFLFSQRKIFTSFLSSYNRERHFPLGTQREFGIKQKSHILHSYFFGQKLEDPVIFCPRTNEVDHFDHNVHNFHQM